MINDARVCTFCQRKDGLMIGPFRNTKNADEIRYFHKDCIEVNDYSFYNSSKSKWLNIGKAIEQLLVKSPKMCSRCGVIGATIKCKDCNDSYHGYVCSTLYLLALDQRTYQCFSCRNKENYRNFRAKEPSFDKKEHLLLRKQMAREHLLQTK